MTLQVLFRLNFLVVLLCLTMNRPYQFYYFVPLVSFWFLVVYAVLGVWPRAHVDINSECEQTRTWLRRSTGVRSHFTCSVLKWLLRLTYVKRDTLHTKFKQKCLALVYSLCVYLMQYFEAVVRCSSSVSELCGLGFETSSSGDCHTHILSFRGNVKYPLLTQSVDWRV